MLDVLFWLFVVILLAGAAFAAVYYFKDVVAGSLPNASVFRPRQEKRLDVVEQWNVDGRRRLVLIRRDNVEHLLMTGGPVDVLIETGIEAKPAAGGGDVSARGFASRATRSSGTTAGDM